MAILLCREDKAELLNDGMLPEFDWRVGGPRWRKGDTIYIAPGNGHKDLTPEHIAMYAKSHPEAEVIDITNGVPPEYIPIEDDFPF